MFQTNLGLNMVEIRIFGGKIKISVFGKKGCIFQSLCFSEPVMFFFWTVELLNYFCFWIVMFLNCFASELLSFWTIFVPELFFFWTVELLNYLSFWTSLLLKWVSLLNCYVLELFCFWTVELLNYLSFWTSLLLKWVSLLNCFASELSCTYELNRASEQNCCFWAAPCLATLDFSLRTRMLFFENDLYWKSDILRQT